MSLVAPDLMDLIEANGDWDTTMSGRLFPVNIPDGRRDGPFCRFRLTKEGRDYALDGPAELFMADFQFELLSSSYRQAHELASLLMQVLDNVRGLYGDTIFDHILFMDTRDGESKDEVLDLYSVFCDVSVWHIRA